MFHLAPSPPEPPAPGTPRILTPRRGTLHPSTLSLLALLVSTGLAVLLAALLAAAPAAAQIQVAVVEIVNASGESLSDLEEHSEAALHSTLSQLDSMVPASRTAVRSALAELGIPAERVAVDPSLGARLGQRLGVPYVLTGIVRGYRHQRREQRMTLEILVIETASADYIFRRRYERTWNRDDRDESRSEALDNPLDSDSVFSAFRRKRHRELLDRILEEAAPDLEAFAATASRDRRQGTTSSSGSGTAQPPARRPNRSESQPSPPPVTVPPASPPPPNRRAPRSSPPPPTIPPAEPPTIRVMPDTIRRVPDPDGSVTGSEDGTTTDGTTDPAGSEAEALDPATPQAGGDPAGERTPDNGTGQPPGADSAADTGLLAKLGGKQGLLIGGVVALVLLIVVIVLLTRRRPAGPRPSPARLGPPPVAPPAARPVAPPPVAPPPAAPPPAAPPPAAPIPAAPAPPPPPPMAPPPAAPAAPELPPPPAASEADDLPPPPKLPPPPPRSGS